MRISTVLAFHSSLLCVRVSISQANSEAGNSLGKDTTYDDSLQAYSIVINPSRPAADDQINASSAHIPRKSEQDSVVAEKALKNSTSVHGDSEVVQNTVTPSFRDNLRQDVNPYLFLAAFSICGVFLALCGYKRFYGADSHAITTKCADGDEDAKKYLYTSVDSVDKESEKAEDWDDWEAEEKDENAEKGKASLMSGVVKSTSLQSEPRLEQNTSAEVLARAEQDESKSDEGCKPNTLVDIFNELGMRPNIRYAQPVSQIGQALNNHPSILYSDKNLHDLGSDADAEVGAAWEGDEEWVEGL